MQLVLERDLNTRALGLACDFTTLVLSKRKVSSNNAFVLTGEGGIKFPRLARVEGSCRDLKHNRIDILLAGD